jgi:hypothetical protein
MLNARPQKSNFTELEAAQVLGITVEELRSLIRSHIVVEEHDMSNVAMTSFQPSDLLLLRILVAQRGFAAVAVAEEASVAASSLT